MAVEEINRVVGENKGGAENKKVAVEMDDSGSGDDENAAEKGKSVLWRRWQKYSIADNDKRKRGTTKARQREGR